jgi:hypothetical protein
MFSIFKKIKLQAILNEKPVSDKFGFDRGTPIDRYYIEKFLSENKAAIKGKALEIAEDTYLKKFGARETERNILHFDNTNPVATIVGDLSNKNTLPKDTFDCFICTQTFNFIYDFNSAIAGSHYLLKPGGTLLATLACMSPISKYDADRWGDFWRFTPQSAQRSFELVFGAGNVSISCYGNSAAAALFMKGYALEEVKDSVNLDHKDELFPLIIGVKAKK